MGLRDLVGKQIKIKRYVNGKGSPFTVEKWLVVAAYPAHVMAIRTCENGYQVKECFGIGELVQMGLIRKEG